MSIFLAFIKSVFFLVYFLLCFDGTYTFSDDIKYLEGGRLLVENKIGFHNIDDNISFLIDLAGGYHFLYYLHNASAIRIFGDGYYAPIVVNVLLSVLIGLLGTKLAHREFFKEANSSRVFFVFLILHPNILFWSSIVNVKDIFVLLCHVVLLLSISYLLSGYILKAALLASPSVFLLIFLRFYVPIIFVVAMMITFVIFNREFILSKIFLCIIILLSLGYILGDKIGLAFNSLLADLNNPFYGFFRMILTPIPFNTSGGYVFLDIPSLLHWLLAPFFLFGFFCFLRMRAVFCKFIVIYFILFIGLYSFYGELQGPRHRIQLEYIIAVFQFCGLLMSLKFIFHRKILL